MNKYALALIALFAIQPTFSQSYDLAAGVRLGTDLGVSVKMRVPPLDENFTGEFIIQSSLERQEGLITLLGEQHFPLITRRINLYAGIGLHAGWLEEDPDRDLDYKAPAGVSLIGGAELNFKRLNVSVDFKPAINLSGGDKTFYSQSAVTIRYIPFQRYDIFASPKEKRKRQRQEKRRKKAQDRAASGRKSWQFWKKG
jgi:hypothetical protein